MQTSIDGLTLDRLQTLDKKSLSFILRLNDYLETHHPEPQTTEEYFIHLLRRGAEARLNGNYGIAACVVFNYGGLEIIIYGANSLVSGQNPAGHAEMNAIAATRELMVAIKTLQTTYPESQQQALKIRELLESYRIQRKITIRPNSANRPDGLTVYTTLEPCPMCTVALLNGGVKEVVIGAEDSIAGSLEEGRLANLPELWKIIADAQGIKVRFCSIEEPTDKDGHHPNLNPYSISPGLKDLLVHLFEDTRVELDEHLKEHSFMSETNGILAHAINCFLITPLSDVEPDESNLNGVNY